MNVYEALFPPRPAAAPAGRMWKVIGILEQCGDVLIVASYQMAHFSDDIDRELEGGVHAFIGQLLAASERELKPGDHLEWTAVVDGRTRRVRAECGVWPRQNYTI